MATDATITEPEPPRPRSEPAPPAPHREGRPGAQSPSGDATRWTAAPPLALGRRGGRPRPRIVLWRSGSNSKRAAQDKRSQAQMANRQIPVTELRRGSGTSTFT